MLSVFLEDLGRQAEVDEENLPRVVVANNDIFQLDVSVNEVEFVQLTQELDLITKSQHTFSCNFTY